MRRVLLAALVLASSVAWADAGSVDLGRLAQLATRVANYASSGTTHKGGPLGRGVAKLDSSRRRPGQADDTPIDIQTPAKDIIEMRHLARLAQEKAMRLGIKDINLTRNVNSLCDAYDKRHKQRKLPEDGFDPAIVLEQMLQQISLIKKAEQEVDMANALSEVKSQPAPQRKLMPEKRSGKQLADALWEKRKGIIKADSSAAGLAPSTVAAYLRTLTKSQDGQFESLRSKYLDRGFSPADAAATALLELHGQLKAHPDNGGKEAEAILKRLGDEAEDDKP